MSHTSGIHLMFISSNPSPNDLQVIQTLPEHISQIAFISIPTSGEETLQICKQNVPDVVIVDSAVWDIDTLEVIKRLKTLFSNMLTIVLDDAEAYNDTHGADVDLILHQPLDLHDVVTSIRASLG